VERNIVKKSNEAVLETYQGLPEGAFYAANLPPQAAAVSGSTDKGVWSTAVTLYTSMVDPQTGRTYTGAPLDDMADGTVQLAAATCRGLATKYSAASDARTGELEVAAATHLAEAVDRIEHCSGLLNEPLPGPDGQLTDGRTLQAIQQADEELAAQRSAEGDSRHTEQQWATAWRTIAAVLLSLLDVMLLWKPLLNLSFEASSVSVVGWVIGAGVAGLQVVGIEWAARNYVDTERRSADRRAAMGDYNRTLRGGMITSDRAAPDLDELIDADTKLTHSYRALVLMATAIAIIGGVRVAVLAKRAEFQTYEAALFGTLIGLILGGVVIQMARLFCRGNLLGDRLRIESEGLDALHEQIRLARGAVAEERELTLRALAGAEIAAGNAVDIRGRTVADYWHAVRLAWTWFGLPHSTLDHDGFKLTALPVESDDEPRRIDLRKKLGVVNEWLADRPTVFTPSRALALLGAGTGSGQPQVPTRNATLLPPANGRLTIVESRPVKIPPNPTPPHALMLLGAALAVIATVTTAFIAASPAQTDVDGASVATLIATNRN
jgi:hypothetical protein